jgi:hypothetical protein
MDISLLEGVTAKSEASLISTNHYGVHTTVSPLHLDAQRGAV